MHDIRTLSFTSTQILSHYFTDSHQNNEPADIIFYSTVIRSSDWLDYFSWEKMDENIALLIPNAQDKTLVLWKAKAKISQHWTSF